EPHAPLEQRRFVDGELLGERERHLLQASTLADLLDDLRVLLVEVVGLEAVLAIRQDVCKVPRHEGTIGPGARQVRYLFRPSGNPRGNRSSRALRARGSGGPENVPTRRTVPARSVTSTCLIVHRRASPSERPWHPRRRGVRPNDRASVALPPGPALASAVP